RSKPPVQVSDPSISVTGMIQTNTMVDKLTKSPVPCGLVSRLLFAMPASVPRGWTNEKVQPSVGDGYAAVIRTLQTLVPDQVDQEGVAPEEQQLVEKPPPPIPSPSRDKTLE